MKRQRGVTTVEFAIVGLLAMVLLFGVIEISYALFLWNSLTEAARRGARVAAVCPVNHPAVARVAIFGQPTGTNTTSPVLPGLSTANVQVTYLEQDGTTATTDYSNIYYVRVAITGYQYTLLIPTFLLTLTAPPFTTTLPSESLGYVPDTGTRQCYGS